MMIESAAKWWEDVARRHQPGSGPAPNDRWRRNNRALGGQRLSQADLHEVSTTLALAVLGLIAIVMVTVGVAALAPVTSGQFSAVDEIGYLLDAAPPAGGVGR